MLLYVNVLSKNIVHIFRWKRNICPFRRKTSKQIHSFFVHKLCWEHRIRRRSALSFLFFCLSGYHIAFQLILFFMLYNCLNHVLTVTSRMDVRPFETRTFDGLYLSEVTLLSRMLYDSDNAFFRYVILWDNCKLLQPLSLSISFKWYDRSNPLRKLVYLS